MTILTFGIASLAAELYDMRPFLSEVDGEPLEAGVEASDCSCWVNRSSQSLRMAVKASVAEPS